MLTVFDVPLAVLMIVIDHRRRSTSARRSRAPGAREAGYERVGSSAPWRHVVL